jgi:predicted transcriptional regulator
MNNTGFSIKELESINGLNISALQGMPNMQNKKNKILVQSGGSRVTISKSKFDKFNHNNNNPTPNTIPDLDI